METEKIKQALITYCAKNNIEKLDLKSVMFDMDGVLFDSMPYHAKSWHKAMADFGLDLPEDEAFLHEGRTGSGTINIVMQRQIGRSPEKSECEKIYQRKSEYFNQFPTPVRMPGAFEVVENVKSAGLTPIVVTGSGQLSLLDRLERNFPGLFKSEWMVSAKDVKMGKPNPEPYLMGLKHARTLLSADVESLYPYNSLVVENAPLGVKAGSSAGCFVIAVNTGPLKDDVLIDAGADILFHSMTELSENILTLICESRK